MDWRHRACPIRPLCFSSNIELGFCGQRTFLTVSHRDESLKKHILSIYYRRHRVLIATKDIKCNHKECPKGFGYILVSRREHSMWETCY
jgi:hypothetical protein